MNVTTNTFGFNNSGYYNTPPEVLKVQQEAREHPYYKNYKRKVELAKEERTQQLTGIYLQRPKHVLDPSKCYDDKFVTAIKNLHTQQRSLWKGIYARVSEDKFISEFELAEKEVEKAKSFLQQANDFAESDYCLYGGDEGEAAERLIENAKQVVNVAQEELERQMKILKIKDPLLYWQKREIL